MRYVAGVGVVLAVGWCVGSLVSSNDAIARLAK